jgi:alginate O-acetyltransferase complex protein AlgI
VELFYLSVFAICSALIGWLAKGRNRTGLLLALSVWAVFWLQPSSRIKGLDFWLPIATLGITILSWVLATPAERRSWRENWKSALIIFSVVIVWALLPYLQPPKEFGFSLQPMPAQALLALCVVVLLAGLLSRSSRPVFLWVALIGILALFVVIKTPSLTVMASSFLRLLTGQSQNQALAVDIRWFGYSYVAFRIMHTLLDRRSGQMPFVTLGEYVTYVVFYPSLAAGPIDKIERFTRDLHKPLSLAGSDWLYAGERILLGVFKKFVLADTLALLALTSAEAALVHAGLWAWVVVYAYSFQIYFDFSGYTDIAIGIARLVGVNLPENFRSPYLRSNLAQFWNSWHMSLTQWFRSYFFNPLARALRSNRILPVAVIILITQMATMLVIGLWHGVALRFILWGLWQGIGLFVQNRWSEFARIPIGNWASTPARKSLLALLGVVLTFNYVTIGWVFFAMPSASSALEMMIKLIGWKG